MNNMNAFDLTASALMANGLSPEKIREELCLSQIFQSTRGEKNIEDEIKKPLIKEKELKPLDPEDRLRNLLLDIGIPCNLKGYYYIIKAVMFYRENPNQIITKELYPKVGKEFKSTDTQVERSIRSAIKWAWSCCSVEVLNEIFGNTCSMNTRRPTNSQFIARCAEWLNQEQ